MTIKYVRLSLEPGDDDGTFAQPVKLFASVSPHASGRVVVRRGDTVDALTPGHDMVAPPGAGRTTADRLAAQYRRRTGGR